MKIAATVTICAQTGPDSWRNGNLTRIFDSSQSVDEMLAWVKTLGRGFGFNDLTLSVVDEPLQGRDETPSVEQYPDTEADGVVFCGKCGHERK